MRAKLRTIEDLIRAARDLQIELPEVVAAGAVRTDDRPITVLFGTESGGSELAASEVARHLGEDVTVSDLADVTPADLEPGRLYLVLCSTYGDGEVPTSARPFHGALTAGGVDLGGVQDAMFGMGDRSYRATYSRGSELLDEALSAAGATRVGDYGRHDAGGPVPASDAAIEWVDGVLAAVAAR